MDAYQRYNTNAGPPPHPPPPPPSVPELQQDQLQNHHPAPPPPQWYPGQNHYQPTLQPPPPPVPGLHQQYPPQPHQWGPPPAAYPNQHYLPHQYPPPHLPPPMHPPPYHHSQVPSQPYSAGHQAGENPNLTHQQGYEYQGKSNEDDWAARARAWAAAKAATDNQQKQSTFPQGMRPDLQTPFHDPYVHGAEHQHLEPTPGSYPNANLQNPYESGNYQQVSLPDGQSNNASGAYHNGLASLNSASASAGPNNHLPNDGSLADESNTTVHQLEVPSSYSSITGNFSVSL